MERPIFYFRWERKALYRRKQKTKNKKNTRTHIIESFKSISGKERVLRAVLKDVGESE